MLYFLPRISHLAESDPGNLIPLINLFPMAQTCYHICNSHFVLLVQPIDPLTVTPHSVLRVSILPEIEAAGEKLNQTRPP